MNDVATEPPRTEKWRRVVCGAAGVIVMAGATLRAHSGPPYPIVSDRVVGAYQISIWTDPDATDDGSAAGKFWVMMQPARAGAIPPDTRVSVAIRPLDRPGAVKTALAAPVDKMNRDAGRQFVALLMDHEGPYGVRVAVEGPLGTAELNSDVSATYDLRPAPILMALYVMPFLLVGFLWVKLLVHRRRRVA
jgi:hypothetical protein